MFQTIYLGKLVGIKIYIHWTFWLLAIYVMVANLKSGFGGATSALGFVFAVFGCVFLHEMGHAMAAKWFGIRTEDITLLPIGGLARMAEFPRRPIVELVVAIAGPLVNVAIAIILAFGLGIQAHYSKMAENGLVEIGPWEQLLIANVVLAVFNMLPSYPMDGGRVLRSLLAMVMPYPQATVITARTGQIMAVIMFVASFFFSFTLMIIAFMVFGVCTGELLKVRIETARQQMQGQPSPFSPMQPRDNDEADIIDAVEVRRVT
jgi:Zn-dependent protease